MSEANHTTQRNTRNTDSHPPKGPHLLSLNSKSLASANAGGWSARFLAAKLIEAPLVKGAATPAVVALPPKVTLTSAYLAARASRACSICDENHNNMRSGVDDQQTKRRTL